MSARPRITVAAVIERGGQFLLVEEEEEGRLVFNQPSGHLELHESLVDACRREVLEESAWHFLPRALVGIYLWSRTASGSGVAYLRFGFCGELGGHEPRRKLDTGIARAVWLHGDEIRATRDRHRSPLVLQCVEDYLAGKRYPLDALVSYV